MTADRDFFLVSNSDLCPESSDSSNCLGNDCGLSLTEESDLPPEPQGSDISLDGPSLSALELPRGDIELPLEENQPRDGHPLNDFELSAMQSNNGDSQPGHLHGTAEVHRSVLSEKTVTNRSEFVTSSASPNIPSRLKPFVLALFSALAAISAVSVTQKMEEPKETSAAKESDAAAGLLNSQLLDCRSTSKAARLVIRSDNGAKMPNHHPLTRLSGRESLDAILRFLNSDGTSVECHSSLGIAIGVNEPLSTELVHVAFDKMVEADPNKPAVVFGTEFLTYIQLKRRSEQLAAYLQNLQIGKGDIVAIYQHRSLELIVSMLAVSRVGAAYLPLDPTYGRNRIQVAITSCCPTLALTNCDASQLPVEVSQLRLLDVRMKSVYEHSLEFTPNDSISGFDPIAIFCTSGSTGDPKAVILLHVNISNLCVESGIKFDTALQFSPTGFDASIFEVFATITTGGTLVMIGAHERLSRRRLYSVIEESRATTVLLPAAFLRGIMDDVDQHDTFPQCVTHLQSTGEKLHFTKGFTEFFRKRNIVLVNDCGPTEVHIATRYVVPPDEDDPFPSVGDPIPNVWVATIYEGIEPMKLTQWGETGEVIVGGLGVGGGYVGNDELTREKFATIEINGTKHLTYKTGDRARWTEKGLKIEGRIDGKRKALGRQVVMDDVLKTIRSVPGFSEIITLDCESGGYDLFVATGGDTPDEQLIRDHPNLDQAEKPKQIVMLPSFPQSEHGKNEGELRRLAKEKEEGFQEALLKLGERQQVIATTMFQVLGRFSDVKPHDTFISLGGDSLQLVELAIRLENELNRELDISEVLTLTIQQLADGVASTPQLELVCFEGDVI